MSDDSVTRSEAEDRRRVVACGFWYDERLPLMEAFAVALTRVLETIISQLDTKIMPVQIRIKTRDSYVAKCVQPARTDQACYRYGDPISEISDLVGVRITLYLLGDAPSISSALAEHLIAQEEPVRGMGDGRVPGYQGQHFSVAFTPDRLRLPEYHQFTGLRAELQLRTVLQHAWAEIQHDLIYKPQVPIPVDVQRRLIGLAGILDVADREFEAVTQAFDDVLQRGAQGVQVDALESDEPVVAALERSITLSEVPSAGVEWTAAFLEILNGLDINPTELPQRLGSDIRAQRAALQILREEAGMPNNVQVANALLAWQLGDEYVRRHPFAASANSLDIHRMIESNRERARALESSMAGMEESSNS